ncbi:unnamed protein product, partial [Allacma fusca]
FQKLGQIEKQRCKCYTTGSES